MPRLLAAVLIVGLVPAWAPAEEPKPAGQPKQLQPKAAPAGEVFEGDPGAGENLVVNGDFETGDVTPTGWQTVDGLSSFWVDDPDGRNGKVLKFDTDVLQTQGYEWWAKIHAGASPTDAPGKLPTVEPK